VVEGGEYDGATIIDGVIVNDYGAPIAYRINLTDSGNGLLWSTQGRSAEKDYVDISARDMKLHFVPLFPGQLRGFSLIGFTAFNCQTVKESKDAELTAQLGAACQTFVDATEDGEPPPGADHIGLPGSTDDPTDTATGLVTELFDHGIIRYVRAKSGAGLTPVTFDRPTANQREFQEQIIREAFHALGWSYDFSVKPGQVNGAPMRVVVDKINRMIGQLQDLVLVPALRRFDRWRVSRFMAKGPNGEPARLPFDPEWYKWEYQGPAQLTADKKYDSDVAAQEIRMGTSTRTKRAMSLGETLKDVRKTKKAEVDELFQNAKELSEKYKIPFDLALTRLESDNPIFYPIPAEGGTACAAGGAPAGGATNES
jgi:capsid protein